MVLLDPNASKIVRFTSEDKLDAVRNLELRAVEATDLILWLDGDREGEAISFEVIRVVQRKNPGIRIKRAKFSANTKEEITRALRNLVQPNLSESEVSSRRFF